MHPLSVPIWTSTKPGESSGVSEETVLQCTWGTTFLPFPDYWPSATRCESLSIYQKANSLTSLRSEFCIVFLSLSAIQNAKQKLKLEAEVLVRLSYVGRRQKGDVTGKDAEERCLGLLPELSETAACKRNTREGGERQEADGPPNYYTCRDPCGVFWLPKSTLTYLFTKIYY